MVKKKREKKSEVLFDDSKYQYGPICIQYENSSNKIIEASALGILRENKGIDVFNLQGGGGLNRINLWLSKNPLNIIKMRISVTGDSSVKRNFYFRDFWSSVSNPMGESYSFKIFNISNYFSSKQVNEGYFDIDTNIDLDGFSKDIGFKIYPGEKITLAMYPGLKNKKTVSRDYFYSSFQLLMNNPENIDTEIFFNKWMFKKHKESGMECYLNHRSSNLFDKEGEKGEHLLFKYLEDYGLGDYNKLRIVNPYESTFGKLFNSDVSIDLDRLKNESLNKKVIDIEFDKMQTIDGLSLIIPANTKMMLLFGNKKTKTKK